MVDLATLTGAIMVALGNEHAGLFSNNDELSERLTEAGIVTGERLWRMPLGPEYDKMIDSQVRRHEEHGRQVGRLDLGRAVPSALRRTGRRGRISTLPARRWFVGQRDQSELGIGLRRPAARPLVASITRS